MVNNEAPPKVLPPKTPPKFARPKTDADFHKAKQAVVCAKTQRDTKLFLASNCQYSVSKMTVKFILSMPLTSIISYMYVLNMYDIKILYYFLAIFQ